MSSWYYQMRNEYVFLGISLVGGVEKSYYHCYCWVDGVDGMLYLTEKVFYTPY